MHQEKDEEEGKDVHQSSALPTDAELHMQAVKWSARRQQVQAHMPLAALLRRVCNQPLGFNANMFLTNGRTKAIKAQAPLPCRWHQVSGSALLFGLVSNDFR